MLLALSSGRSLSNTCRHLPPSLSLALQTVFSSLFEQKTFEYVAPNPCPCISAARLPRTIYFFVWRPHLWFCTSSLAPYNIALTSAQCHAHSHAHSLHGTKCSEVNYVKLFASKLRIAGASMMKMILKLWIVSCDVNVFFDAEKRSCRDFIPKVSTTQSKRRQVVFGEAK